MTLTPTFLPATGVKGKPHPLPQQCSAPGCHEEAQQGHHLYPRSHLKVDYDWVELPDGRVISNRVGLCVQHHNDVSSSVGGHRARIDFLDGGLAWWQTRRPALVELDITPAWDTIGVLDPQPYESRGAAATWPKSVADDHRSTTHVHLAEGETCAQCGYTKPVRRAPGPRRPARSWNVTVPADAELGADVLDGWVEDFAAVLGLEGDVGKSLLRYHVLAVVLAWSSQNMGELIRDVREAGAA